MNNWRMAISLGLKKKKLIKTKHRERKSTKKAEMEKSKTFLRNFPNFSSLTFPLISSEFLPRGIVNQTS